MKTILKKILLETGFLTLDGIKITFNESKATEFLLFRQKQLDFLNDIDASFKDEILTLKGELRNNWKDKVVLQIHPYLNTEYFGFLVDTTNELIKNSPTRLKKLRTGDELCDRS
jgi:peptide/nickel transport system substrate-binding protein